MHLLLGRRDGCRLRRIRGAKVLLLGSSECGDMQNADLRDRMWNVHAFVMLVCGVRIQGLVMHDVGTMQS